AATTSPKHPVPTGRTTWKGTTAPKRSWPGRHRSILFPGKYCGQASAPVVSIPAASIFLRLGDSLWGDLRCDVRQLLLCLRVTKGASEQQPHIGFFQIGLAVRARFVNQCQPTHGCLVSIYSSDFV